LQWAGLKREGSEPFFMVGGAKAKTYGTILGDQRLKEPKIIFVWGAKFNSPKSYGANFL
jgi:hypothetical protein